MEPKEYLVTGEEMQRYDTNTIVHFKTPPLILMEQAAMETVKEILKLFPDREMKILILAGKGNNGGDAMAVARLLFQNGYSVTVCFIGQNSDTSLEFSSTAFTQYEILKSLNLSMVTNLPDDSYDMIIDGIFGVGLNRPITEKTAAVISKINHYKGKKIALDIPSGIHASTGIIMGTAFRADYTITFAFLKRGLFLPPGASYAGHIIKKEIGITRASFLDCPPQMYTLTGKVKEYLPERNSYGHKGIFGKILLIAGSKSMGGAAILAGKAAMMTGCGMLRICTHKEQKYEIQTLFPEAILDVYSSSKDAMECVQKGIEWADVIAMGPGMGMDHTAQLLFETVMYHSLKPLVLDADGLNLLALRNNYQEMKKLQNSINSHRNMILTPHPLELTRICQCTKEELTDNGLDIISKLAKELKCTVVKKDARTVVCTKNEAYVINLYGNSGMATAGSGDVLTGIIATLLGWMQSPHKAAVLGVYIHALAGDEAARQKNQYSMLAGDICNALNTVLK